jgi:hypothetical protein
MSKNPMTPLENRLKNLRKILWIVFSSVAVIVLLCGLLSLPPFWLVNRVPNLQSPEGVSPTILMIVLAASLLVLTGFVGAVCLVIYNIFKYRLEKDDELFV